MANERKKALSRRDFLLGASALTAAPFVPGNVLANTNLPTRAVPATGERVPVVGLGSTKVVSQIDTTGTGVLESLLRTLLDSGGSVIDTWSRHKERDRLTGEAMQSGSMVQDLFLATKVDAVGTVAGRAQLERTRQSFGKSSDLIQVFSLKDVKTQWALLQEYKDSGEARYIGATVSYDRQHGDMMDFMRNYRPDFIQVNYSVIETNAESGVLPLAADLGIAVVINRPFMNGDYFSLVRGKTLPDWAAEFDCHSWAQFSLKYILANPAVTCVLTETTKTKHLRENMASAFGRTPDAATRDKMRMIARAL